MKKFGKRITAFFLAAALAVLPAASGIGGFVVSLAEERTIRSLFYGNLLKEGSSFSFYGKDVPRYGMWAYQIDSNPVFCLEPTKKMYNGATGQVTWYDLDGSDLPYGITAEKAEALYYALASGGCFEDSHANIAKTQGGYMMMQSAVWAILSDDWDFDRFAEEMEQKIIPNAKNPQVAPIVRNFVKEYTLNAQDMIRENVIPAFASRYSETAPSHQMKQMEDGTYSCTFVTDGSWMQNELEFLVPDGWEYRRQGNEITFICKTGNPNSGIIKGVFPETRPAFQYWYRPTKLAIVTPAGGDASSRQAQVMMAGEKQPWEVYLQFGAGPFTGRDGGFELPYERFQHEETFHRNYNFELNKTDSETGKPLKDSSFEILEQFDFSQLDGTNLETGQFEDQDQEGPYHNRAICTGRITTDDNGHFLHDDEKTYLYEKTYCGGHPDPIIEEIEAGEDASEEEEGEIAERNEELREEAWKQWQECVDWCEANCDFHSVTEGAAKEAMEADRDEAYHTFIRLKRSYTVREITARTGYIVHDVHNDDIPIEIVEFASSQVKDDGAVTGAYPGNRRERNLAEPAMQINVPEKPATASDADRKEPLAAISEKERIILYAANATPSDAAATPSQIEDIDGLKEKGPDMELKPERATPSNAEARSFLVDIASDTGNEDGDGSWAWDGVLLDSEVPLINQREKETGYIGYSFQVADHRTEGEIHINKRDLELYLNDNSEGKTESYGATQGDATLENAVYGLYALDDIVHPDGYTGKVFSAGELVAIASTDKHGDASFVAITEVSDTSRNVPNLYTDNQNGNCWIGRPLILGRYYVQEISRSEGYELSQVGINLSETNRTASAMPFAQSGTVSAGELGHRLNEWDGSFNDVRVQYFRTLDGFDLVFTGYPEGSRFYRLAEQERNSQEHIITGTQLVEKKDEFGNPVYRTAKGGEYKLDAEGNRRLLFNEDGTPVYGTAVATKTVRAAERLNSHISAITRGAGDAGMENAADIQPDYILEQVNQALLQAGYKDSLDDAPWDVIELNGGTNGDYIDEILSYCAAEGFWDAWRLDDVYEENGTWHALLRYGYKALKNTAVYDTGSRRLFVRQTMLADMEGQEKEVYYYVIYNPETYTKRGASFTVGQNTAEGAVYGRPIQIVPVYEQLYETYAPGEYLLDSEGNKVFEYESQPVYSDITSTEYEEVLTELGEVDYDRESGITKVHVDTTGIDWDALDAPVSEIFRAAAPQNYIEVDGRTMAFADYLKEYQGASVSAYSTRPPFEEGSYSREQILYYPGQWDVYQDGHTRVAPITVQQRCIKQAVKVTKDIAQDSYNDINTYKIHRDPFTVLFGGYKDAPAKTIKGFFFKIYLKQDLINTGKLGMLPEGGYDYEAFFAENPEEASNLAIEWDNPKYDEDHDLRTLHANRGGGKDDYYGTSAMLPYGTYVIVEQQPVTIPTKHYQIGRPKEITLPFVPEIDEDGTVHDEAASADYLYDCEMTPEEMMDKYKIRFCEESHVIYAHNNDGDFYIYKYGLEPDLARDCGNEAVAAYYHYSSLSENAGKKDGVYYEVYRDRDGNILDYGVMKDDVNTMTGVSVLVDRQYAPALVPWTVLDERYGEVINDQGDIGNREPGLTDGGEFNYVSFAAEDFENHYYGSRLRIEKLDSETEENIIHDGALFQIYAAKRDISGDGPDYVSGTGKVIFLPDGTPAYDEAEQIFLQDETGAEVGTFKAVSTIRDGDVEIDGKKVTDKRGVGYIETPQALGAGTYVLVEVKAPAGYVKSRPVAFEVYSDAVSYYPEGSQTSETAPRYQYVKEITPDGNTLLEDTSQIKVYDKPTHIQVHKVETGSETLTYRVEGSEEELKARGDVTLYYEPNGEFAGYGYAVKRYDEWSKQGSRYDIYVPRATLTMYQGLKLVRTGEHSFEGVTVKRNWNDSVLSITAEDTGVDTDIRKVGQDSQGKDIWDITKVRRPPVQLYRYNLKVDPVELDQETGVLYGLDAYGNRVCLVDSLTGLAYVEDDKGTPIAWPVDDRGKKVKVEQIVERTGPDGKGTIYEGLSPVLDEHDLPVYYADGNVIKRNAEWVTPVDGPYRISRLPVGAYIVEETVVPHAQGYVKSMASGLIVEEVTDIQECYMEDDFTKIEIAKLDRETGREVVGAELTLYEAVRIPDSSERGWHLEAAKDFDGARIPYASWTSGYQYDDNGNLKPDSAGNRQETTAPHWIDHIPPGDYLLVETGVAEDSGYVRAADVEVIVEETGEVQQFAMYDDHVAVEFLKIDASTGHALSNQNPARLALYAALLNEQGEIQYGENGNPLYHSDRKILEWVTDDGEAVAATGHEVTGPNGSNMVYEYEYHEIAGLANARYYITETGALHVDYLPVGKYVWVEEAAPEGMNTAAPIYVPVLEVGAGEQIQKHEMINHPITVDLTKTYLSGGTELSGATMAVYRANPDGTSPKKKKLDAQGRPVPVLDFEGNPVYGLDGLPLMEEEYNENYLVERWLSGTDGRYTEEDRKNGQIPSGRKTGDLRHHTISMLPAGTYYYVEEKTPFGFARGEELRFEVTGEGRPWIEMMNSMVRGRLEIQKYDKKDSEKPLSGAKFKLENLDTKEAVILITGADGRVATGYMPIGAISEDGSVSLYRYQLTEVEAPDHYEVDPEIHRFSFAYGTDRLERITYHYGAPNKEIVAVLSKVDITNEEELPGASMHVEDSQGNVIDAWVSTETPHEIVGKLEAGKQYLLVEDAAPVGYAVSEPVRFAVGRDGRVEPVVMKDRPTEVVISKKAITGEEELPGAVLQLKELDGTVIREWTSINAPYQLTGVLEAGKTYVLHEAVAADGWAYAGDITFTVHLDGSVDRVIMRDRPTHVKVSKTEQTGITGLSGAHMEIRKPDGQPVIRWISDGTPMDIIGRLSAGQDYILHEEMPPDGYAYSEDIPFTVAMDGTVQELIMKDRPTVVAVSKKAITGEEEIPGTKLRIETVDGVSVYEWTSSDEPCVLTGILKADTDYVLVETQPAPGYAYSESVRFHVSRDGSVDQVEMRDRPTDVRLSKKQITGEEELPGATMQVVDREGSVIDEWISGDTPHELTGVLTAGETYYLREKLPVPGWAYGQDVLFQVSRDGSVDQVVMRDKPTHVEIEKAKSTGGSLAGAHLQLLDSFGTVVREWTSNGEREVIIGGLIAGAEYRLVETQAPSGYEVAAPVTFRVAENGEVQVIIMYDRLRTSGGGGGGEIPKEPEMSIRKVDQNGSGLAGAQITVYREDGSVLFTGSTGRDGRLYLPVPESGRYTYRETAAPPGYLLNSAPGTFEVKGSSVVADTLVITDVKSPEVVINKLDAETKAPLAGAKIAVFQGDRKVFEGVTGADGAVRFIPDSAGDYVYLELESPEGYQRSNAQYRFSISKDGNITGEQELLNYRTEKKIGSIMASYHGSGKFTGVNLRFGDHGKITFGPKTGDDTPILLYLLLITVSLGLLLLEAVRHKHLKCRNLGFLVITFALVTASTGTSFAAEEADGQSLEKTKIFYTSDPSNIKPEFEETIRKNGITYQLLQVENIILDEGEAVQEKRTVTITSVPFVEGTKPPTPDPAYTADGVRYGLVESRVVEATLSDRKKEVSSQEIYEEVEQADQIPEYAYVSVYDELADESYTRQIPLRGYEYEDYHWADGFEFPLTFIEYDAEHYALGNTLIEHNDEKPALEGKYDALLQMIGVSSDYYQIEDVSWISEPWTAEDGVTYRTALATGKKLVGTCRATYQGVVGLKEYPAKALESTYEEILPGRQPEKQYTIQSVAMYQALSNQAPAENEPQKTGLFSKLWDFISRHPVASVGLLLLLLFVISLLLILARKKRNQTNDRV
ncbi:SpaA isopeptide-forming pilin-related protein (plasmid) [Enterocloster clostridioformis]